MHVKNRNLFKIFQGGFIVNDKSLPDTDEIETFIFAEDKYEQARPNSAVAVLEDSDDVLATHGNFYNIYKKYFNTKNKETKKSVKKKKKKKNHQ